MPESEAAQGLWQFFMSSTGGIEFTDLVVSGNTVAFKETFHNAEGDCFSGAGNEVTVEDDKITLFVWGEEDDPSLCG